MTVAEVLADSAQQAGAYRHPVRFVRHRPDLAAEDLAPKKLWRGSKPDRDDEAWPHPFWPILRKSPRG